MTDILDLAQYFDSIRFGYFSGDLNVAAHMLTHFSFMCKPNILTVFRTDYALLLFVLMKSVLSTPKNLHGYMQETI